jgi:hypothetical protein
VTPEIWRGQNDYNENEFEDNKSDIPISPISLEVNNLNDKVEINKIRNYPEIDKPFSNLYELDKNEIHDRKKSVSQAKHYSFHHNNNKSLNQNIDCKPFESSQSNK